ncbi:MAG TPA: EamA family transporter [Cyanothece sp. UBA12306]|nr:EamA family transporter [Cyanothece sp. UBA12306]
MTEQLELTSQTAARTEIKMALAALFPVLIIFAVVPILIKVSEYEINPNAIIFNRFSIAIPVLGCWNGVLNLKEKSAEKPILVEFFRQKQNGLLLLLLLSGVFSGGQQLLYAWSLTQTSAANSEVLHSMTPLFTTLIGWIFLSQNFERRFLRGIAVAICSSIILVSNDFSITIDKLQGDALALVSAILWSGYLLVLEKLQTQFSINTITTWTCLVGTIFLLPILLIADDDFFPHSWQVWLIIGILGTVEIFTKICLTYSLKRLSSGLVATILLLHPAITAILAWGLFSETLNLLNWLAFLGILLGVYLATSSTIEEPNL